MGKCLEYKLYPVFGIRLLMGLMLVLYKIWYHYHISAMMKLLILMILCLLECGKLLIKRNIILLNKYVD